MAIFSRKKDAKKATEKVAKKVVRRKRVKVIEVRSEIEGKDPYAEGIHIPNPEPNNGNGDDAPESK